MTNWFVLVLVILVACFYQWAPLAQRGVFFGAIVEPDFAKSEAGRRIARRYRETLWLVCAIAVVVASFVPARPIDIIAVLCAALLVEWIGSTIAYIRANREAEAYKQHVSGVRTANLLVGSTNHVSNILRIAGPLMLAAAGLLFALAYPANGVVPLTGGFETVRTRWAELARLGVGGATGLGLSCLAISLLIQIGVRNGARQQTPAARLMVRTVSLLAYSAALSLVIALVLAAAGVNVRNVDSVLAACIASVLLYFLYRSLHDTRRKAIEMTDDASWHWGLFYRNESDPALLVQKRFGPGYTVNFGRPLAWPVAALFILLIGCMFAVGLGWIELIK